MRNIRITIEYDGTRYNGWQRQPNGTTIQELLETAVEKIVNHKIKIIGSGRTDAGVHAINQIANFRTGSAIPEYNLVRAINSMLPPDIAVKDLVEAEESFHARYDAKCKLYVYYLYNREVRSPLLDRYSWHYRGRLDTEKMQEALEGIKGTHNFSSFCASGDDAADHVRTVFDASVTHCKNGMITFMIEADGFLRYMVRNIVGTLIEAGNDKISPGEIKNILASENRNMAGITAPPRGLFLKEVRY
ncbi:MAG: tRNA pseudouridine(38-40) synthase TruA [Syntrophales bacterium]|jgi:tRNA pseudouridine38-40 synthase|nr:tRNA pseudouridine(38-40) synthase TruA [Syntrophales bacterium]MDY0043534.1 tRNA pseudouridine(38-40) synthase TruA [Syntrophales bacterium]